MVARNVPNSGIVTPQTTHICSLIDKALLLTLRAALPVWVLLEGIRLRLAARLSNLDDRHPLRDRASVCPDISTQKYKLKARTSKKPETQMTRIQRAFRKLPLAEAEIPGPLPGPAYSPKLGTKTEGIDSHNRLIRLISPSDIYAYLDGSLVGHGRSSWGYVL